MSCVLYLLHIFTYEIKKPGKKLGKRIKLLFFLNVMVKLNSRDGIGCCLMSTTVQYLGVTHLLSCVECRSSTVHYCWWSVLGLRSPSSSPEDWGYEVTVKRHSVKSSIKEWRLSLCRTNVLCQMIPIIK